MIISSLKQSERIESLHPLFKMAFDSLLSRLEIIGLNRLGYHMSAKVQNQIEYTISRT